MSPSAQWSRVCSGFAIFFASTSLTPVSFDDDASPSVPFSLDVLSARMRAVAAAAYVPPSDVLPDVLAKLTYDDYRRINAIRARAPDLSTNFGYKLEPFHLGWLFKEPVQLYQVDGDKASLYQFSAADFDYRNPATAAEIAKITLPGVAGFRIDCPLNVPDRLDELVAFQGAFAISGRSGGAIPTAPARAGW